MFGWLATRSLSLCRHAPLTVLSCRTVRIAPQTWLQKLPALGSVLYSHSSSIHMVGDQLSDGWLATQRAFVPLLDIHWLIATSAVTNDGPREWCECIDRFGRPRARIHLLPDTDYLVWEAMMMPSDDQRMPLPMSYTQTHWLDSACIVNFDVRKLGGLMLLEGQSPRSLSPLGSRVAAKIAHDQSALLQR